ncbi:MAG: S-methyl-5'-thioinosine phosphorylase [Gammaproteobacteria bacterium]|jgi:5'-deoxy-5'-methylthioadenosine phosphorylase|nr:S-methyl-5'-thioinosine phosphorylase [Gammaproteobacteria bacterium]
MAKVGIIGGSGLARLSTLRVTHREVMHTPFGEASAPLTHGRLEALEVVFLPRHGPGHTIPPHKINYRANIWALKHIGVTQVIGMAAVGGITERMAPGQICIPDQILDYTWGRTHTFFESDLSQVTHIDFTEPYCDEVRQALVGAGRRGGIELVVGGTYAATQGPRLETAQEIRRIERDGGDIVGMTGMPEAALAREVGLCYACCAVVVNRAAGKGEGPITMAEIEANLLTGMEKARGLLACLEV